MPYFSRNIESLINFSIIIMGGYGKIAPMKFSKSVSLYHMLESKFDIFPNDADLTLRLTLLPFKSNYASTSSSGKAIFPISTTEKGS